MMRRDIQTAATRQSRSLLAYPEEQKESQVAKKSLGLGKDMKHSTGRQFIIEGKARWTTVTGSMTLGLLAAR